MSAATSNRPRVLIVDDEPVLGLALQERVRELGYDCLWVDSAMEGLTQIAFGDYELVLTDLQMPKVDGIELLRASEELDPALPVVLVTDAGEPEAAVEAVRARAFDFLWKPIELELLRGTVERGVAARRRAVAEREAATAERQRLERRSLLLSLLFEQGSDGVLTWDTKGHVVDLSPSVAALTGVLDVDLDSELDERVAALFEREPFGGSIEDWLRALSEREAGDSETREVVVRTLEGPMPALLELSVCELPPPEAGERPVRWIVGLLQPPRREDLRERLRRADRLAGAATLAGAAAHEIKNDLGPLLACLALLEDAARGDAGLGEVLDAARDSVERIETAVERILAPLRPQEPPRRVSVAELIRDSVWFLRRTGGEPRIPIKLEIEDALPGLVARPEEIHQIIANLVLNAREAIQATPPELRRRARLEGASPAIHVRARHDAAAGRIVLEVADEGPGIPPELQARAFEPFFTTKGSGGTGLGLPVVRDIVRGLGGELAITSAPTIAGTCVRVSLVCDSSSAILPSP